MDLKFPPGSRSPWMNERGQLLPENLPLDSTLARAQPRQARMPGSGAPSRGDAACRTHRGRQPTRRIHVPVEAWHIDAL